MLRRDKPVTVTLDDESYELLNQYADLRAEGNRSMAARLAIKTAVPHLLRTVESDAGGQSGKLPDDMRLYAMA